MERRTNPQGNTQPNTHSNLTVEQVLKMQSISASRRSSPNAQPEAHAPQQRSESISTKSSRRPRAPATAAISKDLKGTRTNRCPPAGTDEAKQRTLKASFARCKDEATKAKFLAKHNLKPEDMEKSIKGKQRIDAKEKEVFSSRKRSAEASDVGPPIALPRKRQAQSEECRIRQPPQVVVDPEVHRRRTAFDVIINQPFHQHQLKASEAYYYGKGRLHKFCLIARIFNVEKTTESVASRDYICLTTLRHPEMNGLQALQTIYELLYTVQLNAGAMKCEIQHAAESITRGDPWICPLLSSSMITSLVSAPLQGAELVHGRHDLTCESGKSS